MRTEIQDKDALTVDDLEAQILLNDKLSAEVNAQYLRLIDKLRAQLTTSKERAQR
jgi:hypothetical protein